LRRLRAERSWTQEDVAANAGINPRTVRDLEAGRLNVTLDTLERLARAYRVDVTELLRHET
jgi:transcriptional regulator with XRE-family HTH domain